MYTSPFAEYQEKLSNRRVFGVTVAAEGSCSGALSERLLWFRTGLLSNHPNRRRFRNVGRFTVNAQEKVYLSNYDAPAGGKSDAAGILFSCLLGARGGEGTLRVLVLHNYYMRARTDGPDVLSK